MSLFYVLGPCIFHIPVGAVYMAVKMMKAVLAWRVLELLGPQLGPQSAHEPLKLKGHLHGVSAF